MGGDPKYLLNGIALQVGPWKFPTFCFISELPGFLALCFGEIPGTKIVVKQHVCCFFPNGESTYTKTSSSFANNMIRIETYFNLICFYYTYRFCLEVYPTSPIDNCFGSWVFPCLQTICRELTSLLGVPTVLLKAFSVAKIYRNLGFPNHRSPEKLVL